MVELVPAAEIEAIVGVPRHATRHVGIARSLEQRVYILHSAACLTQHPDLRDCRYSHALDRGIRPTDWRGFEDRPVALAVVAGRLYPLRSSAAAAHPAATNKEADRG